MNGICPTCGRTVTSKGCWYCGSIRGWRIKRERERELDLNERRRRATIAGLWQLRFHSRDVLEYLKKEQA